MEIIIVVIVIAFFCGTLVFSSGINRIERKIEELEKKIEKGGEKKE